MVVLVSIFALWLLFYTVCFIWGLKYDNPYTINLYWGKPGSGKSLNAVKEMIKDVKHGWIVYSDDPSLKIKGVRYFDSFALKKGEWYPPIRKGKVSLYFDEFGSTMPDREFKKNFTPETLLWWKTHRHRQVKITVISQSADIDKKVRDMADKYFIVKRSMYRIFVKIIPVNKDIDVISNAIDKEGKMNSGGTIQDVFKKQPIFMCRYTFMPKYVNKYDSFRT